MNKISYKTFEEGDISDLKDLCNKLMAFQAEHAKILPEVMASMNFENRLIPDFNNTERKIMSVAYDGDIPVGFAFASVSHLTESDKSGKPSWAESLEGTGFYPEDYKVPKMIGTYKLLYVEEAYRGRNISGKLSQEMMTWLRAQEDVEDLWVFVANGNESVGKLYEKYGFKLSHSVWSGFIDAYCQSRL